MAESIRSRQFDNGLVLVAEPMQSLESAAFSMLVPAGAVYDPADRPGLATLTCEMLMRGCGDRDSRQFVTDLDNLGVERGESVSDAHISLGGATLAKNLPAALAIYADVLRRPHLPADQLEAGRQIAIQELRSVEDDPGHKAMVELRRRQYPEPWGKPSHGDIEGVERITHAEIQGHFAGHFRPNGTILSVAGRIDWARLCDQIEDLFGDWPARDVPPIVEGERGARHVHLPHDANQTQIGIAYDSVPYRDPEYFQAWGGVGVLSGGMSSRLFTEVREKRGLSYSVYASYHSLRDRGCVMCYAGTSSDRAQETLDVTLGELLRLAEGVEPQELTRLKARIKSGLIMQQESSSARSSSIARDWYHLGKARTLKEVGRLVDDLSTDGINRYLAEHPPGDFAIVTLGPQPLEASLAVS